MVLPPALLKCVRIGEKLIALMRLTLYSSFATHSEAVAIAVLVLVDCPNLNRPHAFIPTLHHSSINLAALFSSSPLSPHPQSLPFLPISLQYIHSAMEVFNSIKILPYKSRKTYGRIYPSNFLRETSKGKERNEKLDSTRIEPAWGS